MIVVPPIPKVRPEEVLGFGKVNHIIKRTEYAASLLDKFQPVEGINPEYFTPSQIQAKKSYARHVKYGFSAFTFPFRIYSRGFQQVSNSECGNSTLFEANQWNGYKTGEFILPLQPGINYGNIVSITNTSKTGLFRCFDGTISISGPYNASISATVSDEVSTQSLINNYTQLNNSAISNISKANNNFKSVSSFRLTNSLSKPPIDNELQPFNANDISIPAAFPNYPTYFLSATNSVDDQINSTGRFTTSKNFYYIVVTQSWTTQTEYKSRYYSKIISVGKNTTQIFDARDYLQDVTIGYDTIGYVTIYSQVSIQIRDWVSFVPVDNIKNYLFDITSSSPINPKD